MTKPTRGADLVCEILADEGVRHVFGNPGTTELPLMEALGERDDLPFVLGLQEATVIGMADGYGRATGRPAFVSVHANAGLGNAMGGLTNAMAHRAPMVVTAGNADRRHAVADPLLSGDLVGLAGGAVKWGAQVERTPDLGVLLRRAFTAAADAPRGPVFLSLPMDVLDGEVDRDGGAGAGAAPPRSVRAAPVAPDQAVGEAARLLVEAAGEVVIVAGDAVAEAGADASAALVAIAERLGAPVHGAPFHARRVFPASHPLWAGALEARADALRKSLSPYRRVLLVDHQAFLVYPYAAGSPVPDGTDLVHVSSEADQVGRTHTTRLGVVGDVGDALTRLAAELATVAPLPHAAGAIEAAATAATERNARTDDTVQRRWSESPTHPMAAAAALLAALPPESIVVDEAVTTGAYLRGLHRTDGPDTYWFCRGGGLGWGMPAGLGVSLGTGGEPVLVVVGDGSAMYAPQALWTAARERLPVVFAVVDNGEYAILKQHLRSRGSDTEVGMLLDEPAMDFVALATSMGVPATRADSAADAQAQLEAVWGTGPHVIHLPIAPPSR